MRLLELVQVERQGCGRQAEAFPDLSRWNPVRPRFHQQPEDIEARLLGERAKSGYGV